MQSPLRLALNAFSAGFTSAFSRGGQSSRNDARGGLTLRLSIKASARTRKSRDIAGTLKSELASSQMTLSQLMAATTGRARTQAGALQKQISAAQTTLSQLTSILPP